MTQLVVDASHLPDVKLKDSPAHRIFNFGRRLEAVMVAAGLEMRRDADFKFYSAGEARELRGE